MGMIEQSITELMHQSGISQAPKSIQSESSKTPLDFHLAEQNLSGSDDSSDGDEAIVFKGADAFRKKVEMKFN